MASKDTFRLLSAAQLPLTVALFGLVLNFDVRNPMLSNAGAAIAWFGAGGAAVASAAKDDKLADIRRLVAHHASEQARLKSAADNALAESATAQSAAQNHLSQLQKAGSAITQMQADIAKLKGDRDEQVASVATCQGDNSLLAGQLETLEIERVQLIAELYETAVEEVEIKSTIDGLESQFENRAAYELTQRKKLKSEMTKARADLHTQLSEAQERIGTLESALAEKTQLATQMIDEINGDANGRLTQIGGKLGSQSEIIKALQVQLDEARKTNRVLIHRRFDDVGTDNVMGNRLIDALAKHGSTYVWCFPP